MNSIRPGLAARAPERPGPGQHDDRQGRSYWGSMEPPKNKTEFFSAVTAPIAGGDATVATIRMYGPIDSYGGWWGISTEDVGRVLDALPDTVEQIVLRINSPGGEVWEAMAILNMLGAHRASVIAVVDGLAASAASFIAASCDETVMSPGSQMMIHSPSSIAWGNASEMRKTADFLDKLEQSIVEVYTAKAGVKDWATLLADETWLASDDAVALGLADRVGIVPDAGTATTVGTDDTEDVDVLIVAVEPEDDARAARVHAAAATARAAAPKPPSSSEPGDPYRKDTVVAYDDLKAGFATRLGITEAEVTDEMLFAALDETLAEQAEITPAAPAASIPTGSVVVEAGAFAELQRQAGLGATAHASIQAQRHEGIVQTAINEGRIAPASKAHFLTQLGTDEAGTVAALATFPKGTIPVSEIGHSESEAVTDNQRLAAKAGWGTPTKGA